MKPKAFYIHGLGSSANGTSGPRLAKKFPQYEWVYPEFSEDMQESIIKLNQLIDRNKPALIVGTSLGGLYTMFAKSFDGIKIAYNPGLAIADILRNAVGFGTYKYFSQRKDKKTHYTVDEKLVTKFEKYLANHTIQTATRCIAIFGTGDELISGELQQQGMEKSKAAGYEVYDLPNAGHRMTAESVEFIQQVLGAGGKVEG